MRLIVRSLSAPEDPEAIYEGEDLYRATLSLGDVTVGHSIHRPGWRWSTHVKQIVGTQSCQVRHLGYCLGGRLQVRLESGEEAVVGPGDAFSIPPGHDTWVLGDEPWESLEWSGAAEWLQPADSVRVLKTLLMTDIVDSTAHLRRLGDRQWRELLAQHDERLKAIAEGSGGEAIKSTGDGFLFVFDGPARAIRAGLRMAETAQAVGVTIRAAVHAGEVELVDGDVRGIAVHEVARMLSVARSGELLASDITRVLASGGGLTFEERGRHRFKGFDDEVNLFAVKPLG